MTTRDSLYVRFSRQGHIRPSPSDRLLPSLWAGSHEGLRLLPEILGPAFITATFRPQGPLPAGPAEQVLELAKRDLGVPELPYEGIGARAALERVGEVLARYGLDLTHPRAAAHLQPPSLAVAVAADALASMSNASVDTFDSGPSAIAIERWVVQVLIRLANLGPNADGVMTPGGSMSNLLGLLLARDTAARGRGIDARRRGVASLSNPRVLCSAVTHFSVHRACAALGIGEDAVIPVPCDELHRMNTTALIEVLEGLSVQETPLAIVATAGTTDYGAVDPLREIAEIARSRGIWLHVDAAYGFGALFSDELAPRLGGIELADSITLDMHKFGWQPAAASILLVADTQSFSTLERHVAYLNPSDDAAAGYGGLLERSLQTTRRGDAVKVAATLLAFGRRGLGQMVDACHDLAKYAQARIVEEPELELVGGAQMTTVVFRFRGLLCRGDAPIGEAFEAATDEINGRLRRKLLESGEVLIGRTTVKGPSRRERVCLKFTFLNPTATPADVDDLIAAVLRTGRECATGRLAAPLGRTERSQLDEERS